MIDLITSAGFFKRASVWIALGVAAFIVILIVYLNRQNIGAAFFPPKSLPATAAFGILPKFNINAGYKPQGNVHYELQTVTGELPALSSTAKVFNISRNAISFSTFDAIGDRARKLGFTGEPVKFDNELQFKDSGNNNRVLTVNIQNGNLTLTSAYLTDTASLASKPRSVEEAKNTAINFFKAAGVDLSDFPTDKIKTSNYRVDGNSLVQTTSLSTTNLIRVDFNRTDLDKFPIVPEKMDLNPVSVLVSDRAVVDARYNALAIEKNSFATYPLKGSGLAFEDLKAGHAFYNKTYSGQNLTITSVSLGYMDTDSYVEYLIPVYIFNVVGGFSAYVPAVADSWIQR